MSSQARTKSPEVRHESDVDIRAIFGFGVGLLVAGVVIHLVVLLLFEFFAAREARRMAPEFPLAVGQANRLPPEPRLQTNPRRDLQDLRAQEDAILGSYGWVDQNAGVVRIPIEQAMRLIVDRGLPSRSASEHKDE